MKLERIKWISRVSLIIQILSVLSLGLDNFLHIDKLLHIPPNAVEPINEFAIGILVVTLIVQQELISQRMEVVQESVLNSMGEIINNVSTVDVLKKLNEKADSDLKKIHIKAAAETFTKIKTQYDYNVGAVLNIDKARNGTAIKDTSSCYGLLERIENNLPIGSIWFGITHLADCKVWEQNTGGTSFASYVTDLHDKTSKGDMKVYRIFCFPTEGIYHSMIPTLKKEYNAGVQVKYIVNRKLPKDLSIIWYADPNRKIDINDAEMLNSHSLNKYLRLKNCDPLCALTFETRGFQLVESVAIVQPEFDEFNYLCNIFLESWQKPNCHTYTPAN